MKTKYSLRMLLVAAFIVTCLSFATTASGQAEYVTGSVESEDGLTIHYQMQGAGERALVFVHCWSCDRSYWRAQIDEFSKHYLVVTIDLAGHGESDLGRESWSIEAYGSDVATVVKELALRDVILIGHSMGGPVAIETAKLLPDNVVALIEVDTYQNFTNKPNKEQINQFIGPLGSNFQQMAKMFSMSLFPQNADSALVAEISDDMSSAPVDVAVPSLEATLSYDYAASLKKVRLPIRCINSDRFPVSVEDNKKLAESFDVSIMTGVGHFLHLENPAEFNTLLHQTISEFWTK